jgi:ubiquinol-cytochrome c reductase core subunit 2
LDFDLTIYSALFADLLGDILQQKYQEHEFIDVAHQTAGESANALSTPEIVALEAAHQVAFRSGLGNSIFAKRSARINNATVKSFAQQVFTQDNVALVGSGISHEVLADLAESFVTLPQGSNLAGTQYHGGESRIESSGQSQFVLGFQGAAANTKEYAALEVLRQALGGEVFVKTTAGSGLLASAAAKFSQGTSLKAFNLGYSDAGLFGIQIAADSSEIASAAAAAAEQLKAVSAGLDGAEFERAVNQAKYATLAGLETRLDRVQTVGTQALFGQVATSSEAAAAIAAVTAADVSEVRKKERKK